MFVMLLVFAFAGKVLALTPPRMYDVSPSTYVVYVDGERTWLTPLMLEGQPFVKLEDVARLLRGTESQFDLDWRRVDDDYFPIREFHVLRGEPFPVVEEPPTPPLPQVDTFASPSPDWVFIDGIPSAVTAYSLHYYGFAGNPFVLIRYFGAAFGFGVEVDSETQSIFISTTPRTPIRRLTSEDFAFTIHTNETTAQQGEGFEIYFTLENLSGLDLDLTESFISLSIGARRLDNEGELTGSWLPRIDLPPVHLPANGTISDTLRIGENLPAGSFQMSARITIQLVGQRISFSSERFPPRAERFTVTPHEDEHQEIRVTVDGVPIAFPDQPPVVADGRVLVPVRGVFEHLGWEVVWVDDDWHDPLDDSRILHGPYVMLLQDWTNITIIIGHENLIIRDIFYDTAELGVRYVPLDVPAQIIGGRTMLPLRQPLESVGIAVDWNSETRTVLIN
jgi:hypothetical protein